MKLISYGLLISLFIYVFLVFYNVGYNDFKEVEKEIISLPYFKFLHDNYIILNSLSLLWKMLISIGLVFLLLLFSFPNVDKYKRFLFMERIENQKWIVKTEQHQRHIKYSSNNNEITSFYITNILSEGTGRKIKKYMLPEAINNNIGFKQEEKKEADKKISLIKELVKTYKKDFNYLPPKVTEKKINEVTHEIKD
ncbi:hypothetical protein [Tenacibaculum maritimum]|uniref:hypothetical protein n=1 Tax=Tenacibaculum maritimum TaxID=107401 RepID=UPI0038782DB6